MSRLLQQLLSLLTWHYQDKFVTFKKQNEPSNLFLSSHSLSTLHYKNYTFVLSLRTFCFCWFSPNSIAFVTTQRMCSEIHNHFSTFFRWSTKPVVLDRGNQWSLTGERVKAFQRGTIPSHAFCNMDSSINKLKPTITFPYATYLLSGGRETKGNYLKGAWQRKD